MRELSAEQLTDLHRTLIEAAVQARRSAYAPYSHFSVGAAVCGSTGDVFSGCNVENASYGLSVCAERVAVWKAVSAGARQLQMLALVTDGMHTPCGACRQVLREFGPELDIVLVDADRVERVWITTLRDLLPHAFEL